jgi:murein DD-endopeptidase MepM/ murein hydrolase activator NlpD
MGEMRYRALTCIVLLAGILFPVRVAVAQGIGDFSSVNPPLVPPNEDALIDTDQEITLQAGEELTCYAWRGGEAISSLALTNRLLKVTKLSPGTILQLPIPEYTLTANNTGSVLLIEALRSGVSEYLLRRLNPLPLYNGGPIRLPQLDAGLSDQQEYCYPYPITSVIVSSASVIRGHTMMLFLETAVPILCEAQYLDHTEPCYAADNTHYFVLLGISAMQEPGDYQVKLRISQTHVLTEMHIPFSVTAGFYGFQYITPTASISALFDESLFLSEETFLEPYREVRTPSRSWSLPLAYPLTVNLPISADFGYRRSYGGMFDGYHSGIDYRAWSGLPVLAPADGVILLNQYLQARGNAILIDHGWGLVTGYWHLSSSAVELGQFVRKGEVIGYVGNTGLSTGAHLHWEMWVNGVSVDGEQWLSPQTFGDAATGLLSE